MPWARNGAVHGVRAWEGTLPGASLPGAFGAAQGTRCLAPRAAWGARRRFPLRMGKLLREATRAVLTTRNGADACGVPAVPGGVAPSGADTRLPGN